ncbi:hypothetical protein IJH06_01415 [Candidatus Saccharibacteria bacterium]|nr:hypothetical protein [Candidatus Saccharibacteria bacterium]
MTKSKLIYLPTLLLTCVTSASGVALAASGALAATATRTAAVTVSSACTLSGTAYEGAITGTAGSVSNTESDTTKPTMSATCNDAGGFQIKAVGDSDEVTVSSTAYTNYMVGTNGLNIATGTATSGGDSNWAFKVTSATGAASGSTITVESAYNNTYAAVPNSETKIVGVSAATSGTATATIRTDYQVYLASNQAAGTYTGKVKYTLVHPNS